MWEELEMEGLPIPEPLVKVTTSVWGYFSEGKLFAVVGVMQDMLLDASAYLWFLQTDLYSWRHLRQLKADSRKLFTLLGKRTLFAETASARDAHFVKLLGFQFAETVAGRSLYKWSI